MGFFFFFPNFWQRIFFVANFNFVKIFEPNIQTFNILSLLPTTDTDIDMSHINLIKILNEEDLDAMGIDKPGTRKKILMYAEQLKQITDAGVLEHPQRAAPAPRPKGNSRANPYRCTKCCEFKIRSLDGKAHICKPELVGHSWDQCPTQNIRQHPEERQRRKQDSKLNKNRRKRKKMEDSSDETPEQPIPETVTAWEYTGEGGGFAADYSDEHGQAIFGFEGSPHKRVKIDISQQVADVSAAVMENYLSDELAKQIGLVQQNLIHTLYPYHMMITLLFDHTFFFCKNVENIHRESLYFYFLKIR